MTSKTPSFNKLSLFMRPALQEELRRDLQIARKHGTAGLHYILAYQLGWEGENAGLKAQGKQIRPLLVLLAAQAAGGDWRKALPGAAAAELVHNFSLIHDDIEDDGDLRRGRPTVWKKWGQAQGINAGDTMLTVANLAILRLEETLSSKIALQGVNLLHLTCLRITQGQYLDIDYETREHVTVDEYWRMVNGKTAALIASCTELGALCAGVPASVQENYRKFGYNLGLAFQAQDDLLGIWGKMDNIGKSNTGDLLSGKKTLPIIYGLSQEGAFAARWEEGPLTAEEVPEMAQILEAEGARAHTQDATDRLTAQALDALHRAKPQGEAGKALRELAHKLIERTG
ncbi:MAG: polyprenyl synthetase family protein [Chloroflexota bacterium]|nr:polyprenyl synthetase family protein [Chloroflexota bacterium]